MGARGGADHRWRGCRSAAVSEPPRAGRGTLAFSPVFRLVGAKEGLILAREGKLWPVCLVSGYRNCDMSRLFRQLPINIHHAFSVLFGAKQICP